MIRSIPTKHKLLCMSKNNNKLFIGDAGGNIVEFCINTQVPKKFLSYESPISCIFFLGTTLYFGAWDGCISDGQKKIKVGNNMIKCGIVFENKIFVSVDTKLVILSPSLDILSSIETKFKVFCMSVYNNTLQLGHSSGFLSTFEESGINLSKSVHDTSIIVLKDGLSGSQDCTVAKNFNIIYKGSGWIRSIVDETLFSCGRDIIKNNFLLYSHADEITGVERIDNSIVSIGLDRCIKIHEDKFIMNKDEEDDIMKQLLS